MDARVAYANALATAFAADIDNPSIAAVILNGGLTRGQFTQIVNRDVARGLRGDSGPALFPNVRAFARQVVDIETLQRRKEAGLGTDMSTIGGLSSLGGAIAGAVGAIWGSYIQGTAIKNAARIQLQEAQIVQNSQDLAVKAAMIQNATAQGLRADPATGQPIDPLTGVPLAGDIPALPTIGIAAGILAALTGGYFALKG